jgi:hypothetical protein
MTPHVGFHEDEALRLGGVERFRDLGRAARVRLLAENVFAGGQGLHRHGVME